MNCETGRILTAEDYAAADDVERAKCRSILRDLTPAEQHRRKLRPNGPCGCGSGRKFKRCCQLISPSLVENGGTGGAPTSVRIPQRRARAIAAASAQVTAAFSRLAR